MNEHLLPPASPPPVPDDSAERTARAITAPLAIMGACLVAAIALLAGLRPLAAPPAQPTITTTQGADGSVRVAATSITPITSLTAGTTGALQVSADRIDIWARTSSSTATLNLVEYNADDTKWAKVGADCAVTTDLTLCRYVAKRGTRYWHIYKASGSLAYSSLEALTLPVGASVGALEGSSGLAVNADIPMASHKLTGLSAGSANGDSLRYEQGGLPVFANATGSIGAATRFPTTAGGPGSALEVAVGLVTRTGILRNLYASLVTAPGGTDTVAFTVRKSSDNGATWSSTTLTCTITGTAKGASDTTHAPAVTAGDLLSVQMVSSAGTAATPAIAFEVL